MSETYLFLDANEADLNDILAGKAAMPGFPWQGGSSASRLSSGNIGVLWREPHSSDEPIRPLALVVRPEEQRRLFTRFAQLRSDLAPLSAWCHILPPPTFERMDGVARRPELGLMAAAWTGLIVAEAVLLTDRPLTKLMVPACLATQSYSVARTVALWGGDLIPEAIERFDAANGLLRSSDPRIQRLRSSLSVIWSVLAGTVEQGRQTRSRETRILIEAIRSLLEARRLGTSDEGQRLAFFFEDLPDTHFLLKLESLSPEDRVRQFDKVVSALSEIAPDPRDSRRSSLCFVAGYIATVAAGGAASLPLTQATAQRWPEITAWAYVLAGVGQRVVWTSAFDGLARFVSRELLRPFRIDDGPLCDFAVEEALVLADRQLSDPLVHLKIKQSRIVSVALNPGVNVLVSLSEISGLETREVSARGSYRGVERPAAGPARSDVLQNLADALWPHFRARLDNWSGSGERTPAEPPRGGTRGKTPRRGGSQPNLPLRGSDD